MTDKEIEIQAALGTLPKNEVYGYHSRKEHKKMRRQSLITIIIMCVIGLIIMLKIN